MVGYPVELEEFQGVVVVVDDEEERGLCEAQQSGQRTRLCR